MADSADSAPPPHAYRNALRTVLGIQVGLAVVVFSGTILIGADLSGPCTCFPFWTMPAVTAIIYLLTLATRAPEFSRMDRFIVSAVYLLQFGLHCMLVISLPLTRLDLNDKVLYIATCITAGVAAATLIVFHLYCRAHPLPKPGDGGKPALPEHDPDEIETSGEWDEGRREEK